MSQTSAKPFICIGSFNPPKNFMIQGLLFHSFYTGEKNETYRGKESCPRLYNSQVILEFELEANLGLSTTVP